MDQKIDIYGATDVGRRRTNNEDSFICQTVWDQSCLLLAAIDGVGGYEGGEVAAEICRRTIVDYVSASDRLANELDIIKQAVVEANNAIVREKERDGRLAQMGCVVTVALIDTERRTVQMAHVGDSRLYSYSAGQLVKLSHDHSIVGYREEIGDLTESEAMSHPQRNLIDRCCGEAVHMFEDENFIDAAIFPIPDGNSQFLFCSDGLSDLLTSTEIAAVLASEGSPEEKVGLLIQKANEAGGKDNVTVVIADLYFPEALQDQFVQPVPEPEPVQNPKKSGKQKKSSKAKTAAERKEGEKPVRRLSRRVKTALPWVIVVILLGVIAALVLGNYLNDKKEKADAKIPVQTEQSEKIDVTIVNELDTTLVNKTDSLRMSDSIPSIDSLNLNNGKSKSGK